MPSGLDTTQTRAWIAQQEQRCPGRLMRLSDRGFLEHKWLPSQEAGRPPRHVYRLTAAGTAHARQQFEIADEVGATVAGTVSRA